MGLHRITGFLDERGEFERTWQRVGVWLMETLLQSAAIQATGGSTKVLLSQPRIKFLLFPRFLRDLKKIYLDQWDLCDLYPLTKFSMFNE